MNNEGNICSINDEVIEEEKGKKNNIRDKMKNIESFFKH